MIITALIFDFDGLIVDTETADYRSWQDTYADFGLELPLAAWSAGIGGVNLFDPYAYLEQQVGQPLDRPAVEAVRRQRDEALLAQLPLMSGVLDYLTAAQQSGLRLAIASSSLHSWVDPLLERLGLRGYFQAILCRDDVGDAGKPDPAVYRAALAALDVRPYEAIALEDSPNGATAALAAGLTTVAVPNQMTQALSFPAVHYRLSSLTDLPLADLLARLTPQLPRSNARRLRQFHATLEAPLPARPTLRDADLLALRLRLISEEYEEVTAVYRQLIAAMQNGAQPNPVEALAPLAHELADLLYVTYGALESCGLDADAIFAEVHRANLAKAGGPVRADGKLLKPPGWQPADVTAIIRQNS
jgi:HAD superfamily hydrolase (TIGR01509 family)